MSKNIEDLFYIFIFRLKSPSGRVTWPLFTRQPNAEVSCLLPVTPPILWSALLLIRINLKLIGLAVEWRLFANLTIKLRRDLR